ncbi:N-acetylgalactosamine-6-sulfatase [Verrucomicrobiota bacterium]|nr:N-acetylgalactosamine-6-sulfatase [Verrucomicrobiota bacterium]
MRRLPEIWTVVFPALRVGLAVLIASGSLAHAQQASNPAPAKVTGPTRPNIVFILADDLGYGELGCYGPGRGTTPRLDRMAAEGMRFTQCYAGGGGSAPSRAALLTGLHTGHGWIRGDAGTALRPRDLTVAELLKNAGYKTGAIGLWDLGPSGTPGTPERKGFDQWAGFLEARYAQSYFPEFIWRCDAAHGVMGKFEFVANRGGGRGTYVQDVFSNAAVNFLRLNKPDKFNQFTPFFLYLAFPLPHAAHEPVRRATNGVAVPADGSDASDASAARLAAAKNRAALIARLDQDVGRVLDKLGELQLATNTVVFFSSDHGPQSDGGKRALHDSRLRVPLLVRWPGQIAAGSTNDRVCALWDFLPTASELARQPVPAGLDGRSLLPALRGKEAAPHPFLYWEFHEGGFQQALRLEDWKAVRTGANQPVELFNLARDPAEETDVAAAHPDVIEKITRLLREARTESPLWPTKPKPTE